MSTRAWWSPRIIYQPQRHKDCTGETKANLFLFPLFFFPLSLFALDSLKRRRRDAFCFASSPSALWLSFRILMHHFTCRFNISCRISVIEYPGHDVISHLHAKNKHFRATSTGTELNYKNVPFDFSVFYINPTRRLHFLADPHERIAHKWILRLK